MCFIIVCGLGKPQILQNRQAFLRHQCILPLEVPILWVWGGAQMFSSNKKPIHFENYQYLPRLVLPSTPLQWLQQILSVHPRFILTSLLFQQNACSPTLGKTEVIKNELLHHLILSSVLGFISLYALSRSNSILASCHFVTGFSSPLSVQNFPLYQLLL